jgi:hypothetical protein
MKIHYILTLLLFFTAQIVLAQMAYVSTYDWQVQSTIDELYGIKLPTNTRTLKIYSEEKGRKRLTVRKYNSKQQLVAVFWQKDKEALQPASRLYWHENGKLQACQLFKKGEKQDSVYYQYTPEGKLKSAARVNRKGEFVYKIEHEYNAQGCKTSSLNFQKDGHTIKTKRVYEYLDSCRLYHAVLYDRKEKIKNEWFYVCDPLGEKMTKNTKKICTNFSFVNDTLYSETIETGKKGETFRTISKYRKSDTALIEWSSFDNKNVLKSQTLYNGKVDQPLERRYFKKGKLHSRTIFTYMNNQIVLYKVEFKQKETLVREYSFNAAGDLTGIVVKNKGKVKRLFRMEYLPE